jgi:hypothetical protein
MSSEKRRVIWILSILLFLAIGYIFLSAYVGWKKDRDMQIFQQGMNYGAEQIIIQIAQQASTCQQIPLNVQNQTVNIVAVGCLSQTP